LPASIDNGDVHRGTANGPNPRRQLERRATGPVRGGQFARTGPARVSLLGWNREVVTDHVTVK